MRTSRFKRALSVGLVVGAATSLLLATAPANAAPAPGPVIVAGGSDTTEAIMNEVMGGAAEREYNIEAIQEDPVTVPGDADCDTFIYDTDGPFVDRYNSTTNPTGANRYVSSGPLDANGNPTFPFPNGSTAGRNALRDSVSAAAGTVWPTVADGGTDAKKGCIDIARSSSGPSSSADGTGATSGDKYYFGFALDAVMWSSSSLNAPNELTLAELRAIYECAATDWAQVGGSPGPIQRFIPQLGSGTGNFFRDNLLAFSSGKYSFTGTPPTTGVLQAQPAPSAPFGGITSTYPCPAAKAVQENDGQKLLLENDTDGFGPITSNASQYNNAIVPYSGGKYVTQATNRTNPTKDLRAGLRPGGLILPAPSILTTPVYAVRWTGSNFFLNNATVNGTSSTVQTITNAATSGSTSPSIVPDLTLTAVGAAFDSTDVGKTLEGSCVAPGTIVSAINSVDEVTIAPPSLVTAASNCTVKLGPAAVSEKNPHLTSATNTDTFPGVRMLFNVLNSLSPTASFNEARDNIVGFDDAPSGAKAPLCSDDGSGVGTFSTQIESEGFLPLPPLTSPGGNTGVTCRLTRVNAPL